MLLQTLIFLPPIACIFWVIVNIMIADRNKSFALTLALYCVVAVYFFTDACYASSKISVLTLACASLLGQLVTPCVFPMIMGYLSRTGDRDDSKINPFIWLIIPVVLFCVEMALIFVMGFDNSVAFIGSFYSPSFDFTTFSSVQKLLYLLMEVAFRIILIIQIFVYFIWVIRKWDKDGYKFSSIRDFASRGKEIDPVQLQVVNLSLLILVCVAKIIVRRDVYISSPWVAVLLSLLITCIIFFVGFSGLFVFRRKVSLSSMSILHGNGVSEIKSAVLSDGSADNEEEDSEELDSSDQDTAGLTAADLLGDPDKDSDDDEYYEVPPKEPQHPSFDDKDLKLRFETLMIDEQLFLTQGLTLNDVAARLHSNKTYISKLVNSNYNTTFPDYLTTLRIDYAEQYLLHHRNAKQIEIAKACGFPSASAFNNTFKRVTGETPKIWLATKKK